MKKALAALAAAVAVAGCHVTVVPAPVAVRPPEDSVHADAGRHHRRPPVVVMAPDPRHEHADDAAQAATDKTDKPDHRPPWAERPHDGGRTAPPPGLEKHDGVPPGQVGKDHDPGKGEHDPPEHPDRPGMSRDANDHADHGHAEHGNQGGKADHANHGQAEHGNQRAVTDHGDHGQADHGNQGAKADHGDRNQAGHGPQSGQAEHADHGQQSASKGNRSGQAEHSNQGANRGGQSGQAEHGNQGANKGGQSGQAEHANHGKANQGTSGNQSGQATRGAQASRPAARRTERPGQAASTPKIVAATIPQLLTSDALVGKEVKVTGTCLATKDQLAMGEAPTSSSDWQLAVGGSAIWVAGVRPRGCTPIASSQRPVTIVAKVMQAQTPTRGKNARQMGRYLAIR